MVCVNVILYNYRSLFLTCSGSEFIPDLCERILRIINSNLKTPFYATFLSAAPAEIFFYRGLLEDDTYPIGTSVR